MKTGYSVSDLMTIKPVIVSPTATVNVCAEKMKKHKIGTILVGKKRDLQGVISEQDIVFKVVSEDKIPSETIVQDIMINKIHTIAPDVEIFEALTKMKDLNIRHLPVMKGNKLVGLLTLKDILKFEPQLFDVLTEKIKLREEEFKPTNPKVKEGCCHMCGEFSKRLIMKGDNYFCSECYYNNEEI